jgi:hypothetical protein
LIGEAEASYSLARASLTYLLSGIFDEGLPEEEIRDNVLAGRYRLHWFAINQWTTLTRRCLEMSKDQSAYPELLELLIRMTLERRNASFEGEAEVSDFIFRDFATEWPELSRFMCRALHFHRDKRQPDWNYTNCKPRTCRDAM